MTVRTPATKDVRDAYMSNQGLKDRSGPEFDRWLAEVERAAAEKAWDECLKQMPFDLDWKIQYGDLNPYRRGEA